MDTEERSNLNGSADGGIADRSDDLGTLFAAARELNSADLGAADRFLAGWQAARPLSDQTAPLIQAAPIKGRPRHALRVWASAALGLAAALGGLMVVRPAPTPTPAELPASAAYSVYQSALGDGW
jgi:hypothetical protein